MKDSTEVIGSTSLQKVEADAFLMDMDGVLVLSGVARLGEVERFPYRPTLVVDSVAQIDPGEASSHRSPSAAA
jgi:hypothetical protein